MLKLITPRLDDFKTEEPINTVDLANNVFKVFHGFYGNLFLSKFVNGQTGTDGIDQGVVSARAIWSHGLRDFDLSTVKTALARVMDAHPEFPPTLPQFVALCKACAPRQVYREALPAPSIDRTAQVKKAREALGSIKPTTTKTSGLDLLKQAIADATGCAGGDEAATLSRLDRMFQPKQGATA